MKRLVSFLLVSLVGLAFVIPISSSLSAGTLKVTTPNGGQKWKTGKKYTIKWVKGNAGGTVKIQLLKSNKHYKWVSKKTKNDGKYIWKIPSSVARCAGRPCWVSQAPSGDQLTGRKGPVDCW
jgi:hypothetical protein